MKKIMLSLAALAALASCVDDRGLEPQDPAGNQVVIKAVTEDTKSVLDPADDIREGVSVLWEDGDIIDVTFKGTGKTPYTRKFTTSLTECSKTADFTGDISDIGEGYDDKGYAVYPDGLLEGEVWLFEIPNEQNGIPVSESNLSYATVSLASLKTGMVDATFRNALSLLRIVVPEGITRVTVSSDNTLAGTLPFKFEDDVLVMDENKLKDGFGQAYCNEQYAVILDDGQSLDSAEEFYVHVLPGTHNLTVRLEGEEVLLEKKLKEKTLVASGCYGLDLTELFAVSENVYYASPYGGGTVEIPVVSTMGEETYTVDFDFGTQQPWLSVTPTGKSLIRQNLISLTVADGGNTSLERHAMVRITGNTTGRKVIVKVVQKSYVQSLLSASYAEMYFTSTGMQKGTLSIAQTDNHLKGIYKVTICGHQLYADYDNQAKELICYDGNYKRNFRVSDDFSTITAENINFLPAVTFYKAVLSKGPANLNAQEETLIGLYDESWKHESQPRTSKQGMEITKSDEAGFGQLKVRFLSSGGHYFEGYAVLEANTLKVQIGGQYHGDYTNPQWNSDVVVSFNVDGGTLTLANHVKLAGLSDYSATKIVPTSGPTLDSFIGTYTETYRYNNGSGYEECTGRMIISQNNDSSGDLKVYMFKGISSNPSASGTYYFNLQDGILVQAGVNRSHPILDGIENMKLKLEGNKITIIANTPGSIMDYKAVKN